MCGFFLANLYWKVQLFVLVPVLFIAIFGYLVRKCLRQRIHGHSYWTRKENDIQLVSPTVSDTFLKDSKAVYGGKQNLYRSNSIKPLGAYLSEFISKVVAY